MLLVRGNSKANFSGSVADELSLKVCPVVRHALYAGFQRKVIGLFDGKHRWLRNGDHGELRGMHGEAMIYGLVRQLVCLLVGGEVYLWLRLLVVVMLLVLLLLDLLVRVVVVVVVLCLWDLRLLVLVLLSISPALHHWVLGSGSLPQAMICLYGSNIPSRIGLRGVDLVDGNGPGLAAVVLLGSRVEVVG